MNRPDGANTLQARYHQKIEVCHFRERLKQKFGQKRPNVILRGHDYIATEPSFGFTESDKSMLRALCSGALRHFDEFDA